jgi:HAD superfamily hydrolase (TIGR01450 family)
VLGDRHNHGLQPLPGAVEITRWAASRGVPFAVLTNGTTKTPQQYAQDLRVIGFDLPDEAMLTPVSSAAAVFTRRRYRRVLVLGSDALISPLRAAGLDAYGVEADRLSAERSDAVLVGWYPSFSLSVLDVACQAIWDGAALYSCSQSPFFATAQGRAMGTSRAISAMITSLTGRRPRLVGKPSLAALRAAGDRIGVRTTDLAVVGDDPNLEVPMAHRGRALAVAVQSGLGTANSFRDLPPHRTPHLHVRGVDELLSICREGN